MINPEMRVFRGRKVQFMISQTLRQPPETSFVGVLQKGFPSALIYMTEFQDFPNLELVEGPTIIVARGLPSKQPMPSK